MSPWRLQVVHDGVISFLFSLLSSHCRSIEKLLHVLADLSGQSGRLTTVSFHSLRSYSGLFTLVYVLSCGLMSVLRLQFLSRSFWHFPPNDLFCRLVYVSFPPFFILPLTHSRFIWWRHTPIVGDPWSRLEVWLSAFSYFVGSAIVGNFLAMQSQKRALFLVSVSMSRQPFSAFRIFVASIAWVTVSSLIKKCKPIIAHTRTEKVRCISSSISTAGSIEAPPTAASRVLLALL